MEVDHFVSRTGLEGMVFEMLNIAKRVHSYSSLQVADILGRYLPVFYFKKLAVYGSNSLAAFQPG